MIFTEGNTARKRNRPERPYVLAVDKKTGGLCLRPERSAFIGELPYAAALAAVVLFTIFSYCRFIRLQTNAEYHVRTLSQLQSEYYRLSGENELAAKELACFEDLSRIYEIATAELGMIPANSDMVRLYERSNSEFVWQTEDLPVSPLPDVPGGRVSVAALSVFR